MSDRFRGRDGVELAYQEIGTGRPLVLFHGFTGAAVQWTEHGPALALAEQGHRVILPDLRGHGASARPHDPADYPPDVLADDGLALIDHLGLDDYDLGGYSLGGRVALRVLVRGARPARAIVAAQGLAAARRTGGSATNRRVITALANGDELEPGSPDAQMAYWIIHHGNDPRALLQVLNSLIPTTEAELSQIDTTTLVVAGAEDPSQPDADELAARMPKAQFTQVPGNHWSALTTPEFGAALRSFLSG